MFPTQEQQQQQQRCDSEWRRRKDDEITKDEVRAIMLLAGRLAGRLAGKVQEGSPEAVEVEVEGASLHCKTKTSLIAPSPQPCLPSAFPVPTLTLGPPST